LTERELSVAELAKLFEMPAPRLYHHIDMMLEAGVIEVTRRVPRRGTEERFLRATAKDYTIDRRLFTGSETTGPSLEAMIEIVRSLFTSVMEGLARGARTGTVDLSRRDRSVLVYDHPLDLTPTAYQALGQEVPAQLEALSTRRPKVSKGQRVGGQGEEKRRYRVVMVAYPISETDAK
jgi:hypothetical protein